MVKMIVKHRTLSTEQSDTFSVLEEDVFVALKRLFNTYVNYIESLFNKGLLGENIKYSVTRTAKKITIMASCDDFTYSTYSVKLDNLYFSNELPTSFESTSGNVIYYLRDMIDKAREPYRNSLICLIPEEDRKVTTDMINMVSEKG